MDFLIRDVGVDFLGEVVVFAVHRLIGGRRPGHLCSH